MGVSGVGKTTIGKKLAARLNIPFFDADDFHPEANLEKMGQGIALQDSDRWPWLDRLHQLMAAGSEHQGLVLACSALKESYRKRLSGNSPGFHLPLHFLFLDAPYSFILQRMQKRQGHFMPDSLLQSQFDTLEIPSKALHLDARQSSETIIESILQQLPEQPSF